MICNDVQQKYNSNEVKQLEVQSLRCCRMSRFGGEGFNEEGNKLTTSFRMRFINIIQHFHPLLISENIQNNCNIGLNLQSYDKI